MAEVPKDILSVWKEYPTARQAQLSADYQGIIERIKELARDYDGKQSDYEFLMNNLRAVEQWLQGVFREQMGQRLSNPEEIDALELLGTKESNTIGTILGIAGDSFRQKVLAITRGVQRFQELSEKLRVKVIPLDGVILPPGEGSINDRLPDATDESVAKIELRLEARLAEVLLLLQNNGVFTDDIVILPGRVSDETVRRETYVIIEIPRLKREILVCDQVGEATFVIKGIFDRTTFSRLAKAELLAKYPEQVVRVVHFKEAQWLEDIQRTLFEKGEADISSPIAKIDLLERERVVTTIRSRYASSKEWLPIFRQGGNIIDNYGIAKVARLLGVSGEPGSVKKAFVSVGKAIYGDDDVLLEEQMQLIVFLDNLDEEKPEAIEKLKAQVKAKYPTSKNWLARAQQKGYIVPGIGLQRLFAVFKVIGNKGKRSALLQLCQKIYGPDDIYLTTAIENESLQEKLDKNDQDAFLKLRQKIKTAYPTSRDWQQLFSIRGDVIPGFALTRLSTVFGLEKNALDNKTAFIALGQKIYGEEDPGLKRAGELAVLEDKSPEKDPDIATKIKKEVTAKYPTSREWLNLYRKPGEVIPGYGHLAKIGSALGVSGVKPTRRHDWVLVGKMIYGEDDPGLVEAWKTARFIEGIAITDLETLHEFTGSIREQFPTSTDWMKLVDRRGDIIPHFGLNKIATLLGIDGNPFKKRVLAQMGLKIYGTDDELLKTFL